jgi:hypothetical protein
MIIYINILVNFTLYNSRRDFLGWLLDCSYEKTASTLLLPSYDIIESDYFLEEDT